MDIDKYRIPHMNQNGISMQILSYTSPVGDYVPADAAVDICKMANDLMAEDISKYPDRFRGMLHCLWLIPKLPPMNLSGVSNS